MNKYDVYVVWRVSGGVVTTALTITASSMEAAIAIAKTYEQVEVVRGCTYAG